MTWATRLADTLLKYAERIMPGERGEWARGMSAEVRHIEGSPAALAFALGCCRSAVGERARSIVANSQFAAGLAAGGFYAVHAAIPNSEKWPWIWPAAAGILIAIGPKSLRGAGGLLSAVKAGAKAGAACGIVFFAMAVVFVSVRSWLMDPAPSLESRLPLLLYGGCGAVLVTAACAAATRLANIMRHRL
jgi:hypothetical protein